MIISLLYRTTSALLSMPTVLLRRDAAKDAELLVGCAPDPGIESDDRELRL